MEREAMARRLPVFSLDRFLPYRIGVAAERLSTGLARDYRERFDISIPEWRVLAHLAHAGLISVRDIEKRVSLEKSTVSRAVSRMVKEDYVKKAVSGKDRRLLELSLTARGQTLMAELLPLAAAYQAKLKRLLGDRLTMFNEAIDLILDLEI